MLFNSDKLTAILELKADEIAEFCDEYLDTDALSDHFEREEPFSRKELCQYLGIGESTMTGWLKENRIPLMAKEAFLLPLVLRILGGEIARLRKVAEGARILKSGDSYQIVVFQHDEAGEAIGQIVADNIANIHNARMILAGFQALDLLDECDATALEYTIDHFSDAEEQEFLERMKSLRSDIQMCRSYAGDYADWSNQQQALKKREYDETKEANRRLRKD